MIKKKKEHRTWIRKKQKRDWRKSKTYKSQIGTWNSERNKILYPYYLDCMLPKAITNYVNNCKSWFDFLHFSGWLSNLRVVIIYYDYTSIDELTRLAIACWLGLKISHFKITNFITRTKINRKKKRWYGRWVRYRSTVTIFITVLLSDV